MDGGAGKGTQGRSSGCTSVLPEFAVLREHRSVVVVGQGIVKPWFDDRLVGCRWVAGCIDAHAGFPQPEVAQDPLDDGALVDESHDSHLILGVGAEQRVGFPDFLDEF
jgi:hypothetical protein